MRNALPRYGFTTRSIHEGYDPLDHQRALNPPVSLTSTYAFDRSDTGSERFAGTEEGTIPVPYQEEQNECHSS